LREAKAKYDPDDVFDQTIKLAAADD